MSYKKKFNEEINSLNTMRVMLQTYQEIAAIRMKKIKSSVLATRDYIEELNTIYHEIRINRRANITKASLNNEMNNERELAILLLSNTLLYGDVIRKTFNIFTEYIENKDIDILVVGKVGKSMLKASRPTLNFDYMEIDDSGNDKEGLADLLEKVMDRQNVTVFHGLYVDIMNQIGSKTTITTSKLAVEDEKIGSIESYMFEPSIEVIQTYFENQILASLFEQTVNESFLSKFASRMITLEKSSHNIDDRIEDTQFELMRARHREANSKQLVKLSGINLWGINK